MIGKQLYQHPIQLIILAYENAIDNNIDNPYLTNRQEYENRNNQYFTNADYHEYLISRFKHNNLIK